MKRTLISLKTLTAASMKMYFRNKSAVVFTLIIPIALLSVFGFLSSGGGGATMKINISNNSESELSRTVVNSLKNVKAFKVSESPENEASVELGKGNIDLEIIIPRDFGVQNVKDLKPGSSQIVTHFNQNRPRDGQVANLILNQITAGLSDSLTKAPRLISINTSGVITNDLGAFDFFLPGILSMTVMQLGIFGVAFAFVSLKANGSLRRLQATPVHPRIFIVGQVITRIVITVIAVGLLLIFGTSVFGFHMLGSYVSFFLIVLFGITVFLGFGIAIAGWAKDENQVAPVANIVQLPMLLLSGIFFSRENFPGWLQGITDYFPLTFLADGMRKISNEGYSLFQLGGDLAGLFLWGVAVYFIAILIFKWE